MRPIVIAAGGTGGHFSPAEALATALLARGKRVVLMTDRRAAARGLGVFAGLEHHVLPGIGFAGRSLWNKLKAAAAFVNGVRRCTPLMVRLKPEAVVLFGGFPSLVPWAAAARLNPVPPCVVHEQNAVIGRANRLFVRSRCLLALSFDPTFGVPSSVKRIVTGNPVRAAFTAPPYAPPSDTFRLLVVGGSLGARIFSDVVPPAVAALPSALRDWLVVTQQCRAEDLDRVRAAYARAGITAELAPSFPDMPARLAAAHLVIARAGASTIAELAAAGRPSILVPLPGAIDDHQTFNAKALAEIDAAWILPQKQFTPAALATVLESLLDDAPALIAAAAAARAAARPGAADALANVVMAYVTERAR